MDLNSMMGIGGSGSGSWLPRGAMDLNVTPRESMYKLTCWLPRGAMDLNSFWAGLLKRPPMLAPSWSHGSKCSARIMSDSTRELAPSWSHGSKLLLSLPMRRLLLLAPSWSHGSKLFCLSKSITTLQLAPSWSHGSKYRFRNARRILSLLAPSWSHGSKSTGLRGKSPRFSVGSLVEPWI